VNSTAAGGAQLLDEFIAEALGSLGFRLSERRPWLFWSITLLVVMPVSLVVWLALIGTNHD
jgi:hypothetical protein